MKRLHCALSVVLIILTAGCITDSKESGRENEALIARAKEKVSTSAIELSSNEREAVKSQQPKIQIYRLAGDYADYHFEWTSRDIRIIVRGKGKLSELEGAQVEKIRIRVRAEGLTP